MCKAGLVTLEALSQGSLILVSKNEGSEDLIEDDKNGFFTGLEPENIAERIDYILKLPENKKEEIKKNAINTSKIYSIDSMGHLYAELMRVDG
jgi:glycosyltransferase involved in cell wall biosynthesis